MGEAHKHLSITPDEWQKFVAIAVGTFERVKVPAGARRELLEILTSFEHQCVLNPGEQAPPDPGEPRPHPSSLGTSYHRLGGVYPIAHFAEKLVDLLLEPGSAVTIRTERVEDPNAHRHPPGLKYMLTELLCHATGGPEVVTAKGFDDAKLGIPPDSWAAFAAVAAEAAAVFPTPHHRAMIITTLTEHKAELCFGMDDEVAEGSSPSRLRRQKIMDAGFDEFDAIAALTQSGDDQEKALQMLVNGWKPEGAAAQAAAVEVRKAKAAGAAAAAADGPKCPFGFGGGTAPPGHVPVPAPALPPQLVDTVKAMADRGGMAPEAIALTLKLDVEMVKLTLAPPPPPTPGVVQPLTEPMASAAKTMAERGIKPEDIAKMLAVDVEAVKATVHAGAGEDAGGNVHAGKVVGNPTQMRLDGLLEEDEDLCCPVLLVLFVDPVHASDGFAYERTAAEGLTNDKGEFVSPMTRETLPLTLVDAKEMCERAKAFRKGRGAELLAFAAEVAPVRVRAHARTSAPDASL